jgi:glutamate dehydrogenase (NADP+)
MSQNTTFIEEVTKKPKPEFLQAVLEVAETVIPFIEENKNTKTKCFWKEWLNLIESLCFV